MKSKKSDKSAEKVLLKAVYVKSKLSQMIEDDKKKSGKCPYGWDSDDSESHVWSDGNGFDSEAVINSDMSEDEMEQTLTDLANESDDSDCYCFDCDVRSESDSSIGSVGDSDDDEEEKERKMKLLRKLRRDLDMDSTDSEDEAPKKKKRQAFKPLNASSSESDDLSCSESSSDDDDVYLRTAMHKLEAEEERKKASKPSGKRTAKHNNIEPSTSAPVPPVPVEEYDPASPALTPQVVTATVPSTPAAHKPKSKSATKSKRSDNSAPGPRPSRTMDPSPTPNKRELLAMCEGMAELSKESHREVAGLGALLSRLGLFLVSGSSADTELMSLNSLHRALFRAPLYRPRRSDHRCELMRSLLRLMENKKTVKPRSYAHMMLLADMKEDEEAMEVEEGEVDEEQAVLAELEKIILERNGCDDESDKKKKKKKKAAAAANLTKPKKQRKGLTDYQAVALCLYNLGYYLMRMAFRGERITLSLPLGDKALEAAWGIIGCPGSAHHLAITCRRLMEQLKRPTVMNHSLFEAGPQLTAPFSFWNLGIHNRVLYREPPCCAKKTCLGCVNQPDIYTNTKEHLDEDFELSNYTGCAFPEPCTSDACRDAVACTCSDKVPHLPIKTIRPNTNHQWMAGREMIFRGWEYMAKYTSLYAAGYSKIPGPFHPDKDCLESVLHKMDWPSFVATHAEFEEKQHKDAEALFKLKAGRRKVTSLVAKRKLSEEIKAIKYSMAVAEEEQESLRRLHHVWVRCHPDSNYPFTVPIPSKGESERDCAVKLFVEARSMTDAGYLLCVAAHMGVLLDFNNMYKWDPERMLDGQPSFMTWLDFSTKLEAELKRVHLHHQKKDSVTRSLLYWDLNMGYTGPFVLPYAGTQESTMNPQ
ncbi:protein ORF3 [Cyprinid herpesvirus 3]|uniref:ORF3R n=1 Tax=Cyprinid herpesvirus 3 TaxID=180230 RepID=A0A060IET5_CYHV3|nr:ORF3R [Cyprinid herpesvirus 3]AIC32514.1 ORF3R-R [Cyprinid herpesvirus 3]AVL27939.1 protein ORF3 [Cyprinid herpesvirus 3]AVL28089.1 protein ORF3 [Cyprinid herpesvirus 3]